MRTCRPSLLTCLAAVALTAAQAAPAGGFASPAPAATASRATRTPTAPARGWHFGLTPAALRDLVNLRLPLQFSPAKLLPEGWEPAASSSYTDELHRTTIDLGLRRQFAGHASAQVGARITVLECINIDDAGRFALGNGGSKVHGLIGFSYRY
ncbi:MAG: hypothetical protein U1F30_05570 [Steroidobacteraceae bacterium]